VREKVPLSRPFPLKNDITTRGEAVVSVVRLAINTVIIGKRVAQRLAVFAHLCYVCCRCVAKSPICLCLSFSSNLDTRQKSSIQLRVFFALFTSRTNLRVESRLDFDLPIQPILSYFSRESKILKDSADLFVLKLSRISTRLLYSTTLSIFSEGLSIDIEILPVILVEKLRLQ
jgi:hypothetical protein